MSEVKQRNWIYKDYEREILSLQTQGDALLQQIKQHETKMNRAKQQNLQPNQNDLYTLDQMIKMLLRMLALIDSYRYFQARNEPMTDKNRLWFYKIANDYYLSTLQRFVLKLKVRVNQLGLNQQ